MTQNYSHLLGNQKARRFELLWGFHGQRRKVGERVGEWLSAEILVV
jgi:hypothetical protein